MGAVDLVDPGRVAEVGRARAAARRPRRPRARRRLEGPHLPEVPRRPARVGGRRRAHARRARSRRRVIPRNPLDVLAQQIVAICADEEIAVDELHELVRGAYPFADLSRVAARERARHARRPLPVRRVRRAAAADRLGPHRPASIRGRAGRAAARGHERAARSPTAASSASTSSTAAAASASSTRRWSTRRARGRRSCSAPRPGGSRRSRATACSSRRPRACPGAVPFWKGEGVGRPYELGEAIGATSRELVALSEREGARAARTTEHTLDERAATNLLTFLREQEAATGAVPVRPHDRRRALPRRDRRLAALHPHAVRRPRARAVGDGARRAAARRRSGSRRRRSGRTTGSRSTCPTPTRRRRSTSCCSSPTRSRSSSSQRARRHGALRRALPRERGPRAADPAPPARRAHAALAAAPEGAVAAAGRAPLPGRSRSCSRPTASACRTSSTCPR